MKIGNIWKKPTALFTVLFTLFIWRQAVLLTTNDFLDISIGYEQTVLVFGVYYLFLTLFMIVGSTSFERTEESFYIPLWIILAIISSMSLLLFGINRTEIKVFYLILAGASVGIGIPPCLAYFAENTSTENRGLTGAIVFFFISLMFVALAIIADVLAARYFILFSFSWVLLSLILVISLKMEKKAGERSDVALKSVISNKQFLLYFIPWIMFCLIDAFETPILKNYIAENFGNSFVDFLLLMMTSVTAIAILMAGFLIDYYGRRRILLGGFIVLGVAHALIGFASWSIYSWYIYALTNGLALGVFIVTFVFTIWGDLSPRGARKKYYAIGSLPFFVIGYVQRVIAPYILEIPIEAVFSFASFFLFLAVWPLFNAPETLPEKKIKERELKQYVEKAKKIKKKYD